MSVAFLTWHTVAVTMSVLTTQCRPRLADPAREPNGTKDEQRAIGRFRRWSANVVLAGEERVLHAVIAELRAQLQHLVADGSAAEATDARLYADAPQQMQDEL